MRYRSTQFICATVLMALLQINAYAQTPSSQKDEFYKGKNIELIIGYTPGGGYDTYGRLVARFLGAFIDGHPNIIIRNMPGGGTRVAAGYVYNVAAKDGLTIGLIDQSLVLQQAMNDPSILFDATQLNWIGNPAADNNTVVTWYTTGVKSVEDATRTEVLIGSTGPNTSSQIPLAMNATLGTKFKLVSGYPGGNDMNLAMERGEIGGRGSNPWASWKGTKPEWLREHKLNFLAQVGLSKAADLQDVPLLMDLAKNEQDRLALRLLSAPSTMGRPFFTSPSVPPMRVEILRNAFTAMVKDQAFLDQAGKEGLDINPVSGQELQKIVNDIIATPKPVVARLAEIIEDKSQPASAH
jgi:tripartite-type tricarboxylate transporter receptor subunit TctC